MLKTSVQRLRAIGTSFWQIDFYSMTSRKFWANHIFSEDNDHEFERLWIIFKWKIS
jgi:hypothetical protein